MMVSLKKSSIQNGFQKLFQLERKMVSLPIIEIMIDATTVYERLSFLDGSSGYNQIPMDAEDVKVIAF